MKTESPVGHNRYAVIGRLLVRGELVPGALVVEGDRIVDVRTGATGTLPEIQIAADIVSPGLVDLQVNGGFGLEVGADPAALRALAGRLPSTGVTTFLPTLVSGRAADYRAALTCFSAARSASGARMPGMHLEGPLLALARAGAHDWGPIAEADATLDAVLDELLAAGLVRLVTLAPERPGALERIRQLRDAGVIVSLGHTDASFD